MKKHILLILLLASVSVQAQDTLWQRVAPLGNYYTNMWIDTTDRYVGISTYSCGWNSAYARRFITEDTLQVYGIAAMMADEYFQVRPFITDSEMWAEISHLYPEDPTFDNCEEALLLYQFQKYASPEMQQLGDSLWVSRNNTTPTHYMMTYRTPMACYLDTMAKPIYERYFTTPQTVHDTFYAGVTHGFWSYDKEVGAWYQRRPIFDCFAFDHTCMMALYTSYNEGSAYQHLRLDDPNPTWAYNNTTVRLAMYIFPILTPAPPADTTSGGGNDTTFTGNDTIVFGDTLVVVDTLIVGGDTIITYDTILSVLDNDLNSRLTGVMPNPAAEKARVVSSFGMTLVEVFDLNGSAVLKRRTEGLYTDIDVSSWPAGTYLVRIHTPQGISTKKLVVSR